MENRRRWERIPVELRALILAPGDSVDALVTDVSANGLFLQLTHPLRVGEELELCIELPGQGAVCMWAKVHHEARTATGPGIGVELEEMTDSDWKKWMHYYMETISRRDEAEVDDRIPLAG